MQNNDTYNTRRVDRVNLIVTIAIVLLICIQVIISRGVGDSTGPLIAGVLVVGISTVNYFLPINKNVKGLIFALLPALVVVALFQLDRFALNKHYMIIVTIAMVTLYFKKELIVIYGVIINIALIAMYNINREGFLGSGNNIMELVKVLTLLNGILVLLFFLTKWGNELVEKAALKQNEAGELLSKLENTFNTIESSTASLDNSIGIYDSKMAGINEASKGILISVQQMAEAIGEEASSVNRINESMTQSLKGVSHTIEISKGIVNKSGDMSIKVDDAWDKVNEVSSRMNTIGTAITTTASTVNDLKLSLGEISNLLNNIKNIAGQTNLLALNASIESARAGEQGRGFAVVADQIRKLSEQSKETVANINKVTDNIFAKSEEAAAKSIEGEKAANDGMKIIQEVASYFEDIKVSYKETNEELSQGMKEIASAAENFIEIQEQVTNVASISEENSASTQEILSIIEDENSEISQINSSVSEIHDLSKKLKDMVKEI